MEAKFYDYYYVFTNFRNKRIFINTYQYDFMNEFNMKLVRGFIRLLAYKPNITRLELETIVGYLEVFLVWLGEEHLNNAAANDLFSSVQRNSILDYFDTSREAELLDFINTIQWFLYWAIQNYPKELPDISIEWIRRISEGRNKKISIVKKFYYIKTNTEWGT